MSSHHSDINAEIQHTNTTTSAQPKKGCIAKWNSLSSNIRGLAVSTVLFSGISSAQVIFALSVNSIALLADAAAMFVDVACYIFALVGECLPASKPGFKRVYSLVVSFVSIMILFTLSIYFLNESVTGIMTLNEITWSQSASEQLDNPLPDIYGRDLSGDVVQGYGLRDTVQYLQSLSTTSTGELKRRIAFNGIAAVIHDGILPVNETDASACPDLGPGDQCDMDDVAGSGTVMLAFGLTGLIIDMICLGYAFLVPKCTKTDKQNDEDSEQCNDHDSSEENGNDGEEQNINTLAAYAHVAADVVRSFSAIIAASYIIAEGPGSEYADDIAGAVSSCTIILGSLVGFYEWYGELKEHRSIKNSNDDSEESSSPVVDTSSKDMTRETDRVRSTESSLDDVDSNV